MKNTFTNAALFILLKIILYSISSVILTITIPFENGIFLCFFVIALNFILIFSKISLFKKYILSLDILVLFIILCVKPNSVIFYLLLNCVTSFLFLIEKILKLRKNLEFFCTLIFIKLYKEIIETNLETIQTLESSDEYSNNLELLREMIRNTESMHDLLKVIERYFR